VGGGLGWRRAAATPSLQQQPLLTQFRTMSSDDGEKKKETQEKSKAKADPVDEKDVEAPADKGFFGQFLEELEQEKTKRVSTFLLLFVI
jgi:hypothetical protein